MPINIAIQAALDAGEQILRIYNDPEADFSVEKKADNSPLTIADKASHEVIHEMLSSTGLPILSEEGRDIPYKERKDWESFWLVDPLDGTKEFIKRNGEFTVNIALIENNKPVLGIIFVPVTQTLYVGQPPTGAWKMEKATSQVTIETLQKQGIRLPQATGRRPYTIVGSRSHRNPETEEYIAARKKEHPQMEILSRGSSLKICMVAEGQADEYPRFGPTMEWDTAAGHAIANASDKKCWLTNLEKEMNYNKKNLLNPWFIVQ